MQLNTKCEPVDVDLVRKNAKLNQTESRAKYKKRYDCVASAETFKPGDKVLLRRTTDLYPKMAVNWKEDANNNLYVVVKRVGPVNYSIKNSHGKQKIFHRNMIVPALNRIEAEHTLSIINPFNPDVSYMIHYHIHIFSSYVSFYW